MPYLRKLLPLQSELAYNVYWLLNWVAATRLHGISVVFASFWDVLFWYIKSSLCEFESPTNQKLIPFLLFGLGLRSGTLCGHDKAIFVHSSNPSADLHPLGLPTPNQWPFPSPVDEPLSRKFLGSRVQGS